MEIPKPVDLNRLKSILGGAKQVMDKVETGRYNENPTPMTMVSEDYTQPQQTAAYNENRINNSKMPDAVKKMMLENPPVNMTMNHSFSAEDVSELMDKPMDFSKRPLKENTNRNNGDMITISKVELNEMINKAVDAKLLDFMTQAFTKNLSETVITKTVTTLIKEGKIQVKKKE